MELQLRFVEADSVGYGRYGMALNSALRKAGVEVHGPRDPDHLSNTVLWASTPAHARTWNEGQYTVMSTMWEAMRLPESFRENLDDFELVIVPNEHNVELFSQYHPNVKKVWLGIDPERWQYVERKPPSDRFIFLIGGSGKRKGTDLALMAFQKVFKRWPSDGPVPWLVFKSPRPEDTYGERIERVGGRISAEAERELYGMAHCYLQPSRGEGFGLQPLQAIATGMPTILTDAHGHAEYAHLGYGIGYGYSKSDYFIFGDAGMWWEPNLDELCDQMLWVYHNYQEALDFTAKSAQIVAEQYIWDRCAENTLDAIGRDRLGPYTGSGKILEPDPRKFLVRVQRPHGAFICDKYYQWHPGKDYHETADIKRILFEGGHLDPSCLEGAEPDLGLTTVQFEQLGAYTGAKSYCWTCGQKLGSGERYEPEDT